MTWLLEATFLVTAYGLGCDAPGPYTKAMTRPVAGFTVAADPLVLPIGTIIHIEGLGERMVQDIGEKVKGRHVDVFMSSCEGAREFGRRKHLVTVLHVPSNRVRYAHAVVVKGSR